MIRFAKHAGVDPDVGLRLSHRNVSHDEDAVPVRAPHFPGMTSARQLEPAVPTKGLIYTGRYLHHDSGRVRTNKMFPVVQEL